MTAPSSPSDENHPIEKWTDSELIDQYRYIQAEIAAEDPGYLDSDDSPLAVLAQELIRRDLDDLVDEVQADPASAGREAEAPSYVSP